MALRKPLKSRGFLARWWPPALRTYIRSLETEVEAKRFVIDITQPHPVYCEPDDCVGPGTLARIYYGTAEIGGRRTGCFRLGPEQDGTLLAQLIDDAEAARLKTAAEIAEQIESGEAP